MVIRAIHGTRKAYQHGCICVQCRAAEATYRQRLTRRRAKGRPALGARVPASEAQRKIRALLREGFDKQTIARRLGYRSRNLQLTGPRITFRNLLKVRRLYREVVQGEAA